MICTNLFFKQLWLPRYIENMRLEATFFFCSCLAKFFFFFKLCNSFYLPHWFNVSCFCLIFSLGGIITRAARGLLNHCLFLILLPWWISSVNDVDLILIDSFCHFVLFCFFSPVFWGRIVRSRRVWTLEPSSLCDWKIFGLISILEISLYYRNVDTITYSRTVWNVWNIYFFHVRFILHCPVSLKEILSCWYSIGCIS